MFEGVVDVISAAAASWAKMSFSFGTDWDILGLCFPFSLRGERSAPLSSLGLLRDLSYERATPNSGLAILLRKIAKIKFQISDFPRVR
jgi:hypothetical protein